MKVAVKISPTVCRRFAAVSTVLRTPTISAILKPWSYRASVATSILGRLNIRKVTGQESQCYNNR
jgi:hypothetical protein